VGAGVLLEVLLRNSVECERGNRTFQARSRHTPCAAGAAPAAEVVAVDPDQAFLHTSASACVLDFGFELGRGGAEDINASSAEGELLPAENIFYWNRRETK